MEVVVFKDELIGPKKQVVHNKCGRSPYYYSFKRNGQCICVPFRSNASKVPERYKENLGHLQPYKPNLALDLTQSLVLTKEEYLNNRVKTSIASKVHKYLKSSSQKKSIEKKFETMLKDYIEAKAKDSSIPLIKLSTIQYFHKELDIQDVIDKERPFLEFENEN